MVLSDSGEATTLLTIRVRRDPLFPSEMFMTVRRFELPCANSKAVIESVSIPEVVDTVGSWLQEMRQRVE